MLRRCAAPARHLTHTRLTPPTHTTIPTRLTSSSSYASSPIHPSHLPQCQSRCFAYRPDPTPNEKPASTITPTKLSPTSSPSTISLTSPILPPTSPHIRASSTSISDVLTYYQSDGKTFTCFASQTLYEAVQIMVANRVGCLVAMEEDGEHVAGLVTERDILAEMVELEAGADSISSNWRTQTVAHAMTRSREMVHIKPTDHIDDALALMTSQGFRHLPVLDSREGANTLRGIVSMRNLVDIVYKNTSAGGKAQFLTDILPRTGVPKNTSLRKKPTTATGAAEEYEKYRSLFLNSGVTSIPHPDKKHGEDAFVSYLGNLSKDSSTIGTGPVSTIPKPLSVIAVFDGVGSWSFEQGIDPARFSNECARALKVWVDEHPAIKGTSGSSDPSSTIQDANCPLTPAAMMNAAWKSVISSKIIGSSTACILTLSHESNELRASNIGDSGFLILRHKDARVRVGSVGHHLDSMESSYQVIFRSPQQLHYFNCPLQLGLGKGSNKSGEEVEEKFESPLDADLLMTPVQEGDIIVLATDGLFDNVPEETIVATLSQAMEEVTKNELSSTKSSSSFQPQSITNLTLPPQQKSSMKLVSDALAKVAHDLSVDKTIDSPFAVLAKENNILWKNGGRKDDITVIVARVEAAPRA